MDYSHSPNGGHPSYNTGKPRSMSPCHGYVSEIPSFPTMRQNESGSFESAVYPANRAVHSE
jgi:hypothetical protein